MRMRQAEQEKRKKIPLRGAQHSRRTQVNRSRCFLGFVMLVKCVLFEQEQSPSLGCLMPKTRDGRKAERNLGVDNNDFGVGGERCL